MEIKITIHYNHDHAFHEDVRYGGWCKDEYHKIGYILLGRLQQLGIPIPERYEIEYSHHTGGGMANWHGELILYISNSKSLKCNCSARELEKFLSDYFSEPVDLEWNKETKRGHLDFVNEELNCFDFLEDGTEEEIGEQPPIWLADDWDVEILC